MVSSYKIDIGISVYNIKRGEWPLNTNDDRINPRSFRNTDYPLAMENIIFQDVDEKPFFILKNLKKDNLSFSI